MPGTNTMLRNKTEHTLAVSLVSARYVSKNQDGNAWAHVQFDDTVGTVAMKFHGTLDNHNTTPTDTPLPSVTDAGVYNDADTSLAPAASSGYWVPVGGMDLVLTVASVATTATVARVVYNDVGPITMPDTVADAIATAVVNEGEWATTRITTNTTTVVKGAAGTLGYLVTEIATTGTVTVYDNTSAAGTIITIIPIGTAIGQRIEFNRACANGITVVTSASDRVVVGYR